MGTAQVEVISTASSLAGSQNHGEIHLCKTSSEATGLAELVESYSQWAATVPEEEECRSETCECCRLLEECTSAYIERTKEKFCGHFVCGLCAEAVKEERNMMGKDTTVEDALSAHMKMCLQFNSSTRTDPVVHLAAALRQMLRRSVEASRSPKTTKGLKWQRAGLSRSESCFAMRAQSNSP